MSKERKYVYISCRRACGCAYAVIIDDPRLAGSIIEFFNEAINRGDYVERLELEAFQLNVELMPEPCPKTGHSHEAGPR